MECPHCGSFEFRRSQRRGLYDHIAALLNRWPYRCTECMLRFWANIRQPVYRPVIRTSQESAPSATIEVHAKSHTELNQFLYSLQQVIVESDCTTHASAQSDSMQSHSPVSECRLLTETAQQ
jgi:hypothetical protein